MGQALGSESMEFLHQLISGKALRLSPIGKESMGYLPIDQYKRMLCMASLTEAMRVGEVRYYLNGKCGSGMAKKARPVTRRSAVHTSELQSLLRISYAASGLTNTNYP